MEYRIVTTAQLTAHLRSLRRVRRLTQAQLGFRLGLGQARIGKIERNPAEVSFGQIMDVLAALGGRLVLVVPEHEASPTATKGAPSTDDW